MSTGRQVSGASAGPARWWGQQRINWVLHGMQGSRPGAQASLQAGLLLRGMRQQGGRAAPTWLTSTMAALPLASTCVSAAAAEAAPLLPPPPPLLLPLLLLAAAALLLLLLLLLGTPPEALEL
jgi:hypothetical protein